MGWMEAVWVDIGGDGKVQGEGKEVESAFGIHNLRPTSCARGAVG